MAERVNRARDETNRLKAEIERSRVERAMANIVDGAAGDEGKSSEDPEGVELSLRKHMDDQKSEYKLAFQVKTKGNEWLSPRIAACCDACLVDVPLEVALCPYTSHTWLYNSR